jgi:hypothetical protein
MHFGFTMFPTRTRPAWVSRKYASPLLEAVVGDQPADQLAAGDARHVRQVHVAAPFCAPSTGSGRTAG